MSHWADASYNLGLECSEATGTKAFPEPLSSDDLTHYQRLEATRAALGRVGQAVAHTPRKCWVPDLPPARTCSTLTSPGHLPGVRPRQGLEFIRRPWDKQALSPLTSSWQQLYSVRPPTPAGSFVTTEACTVRHLTIKEGSGLAGWDVSSIPPVDRGASPTSAI